MRPNDYDTMATTQNTDFDIGEEQTVQLNDVKYIEELYPREEVDEDTVSRYQAALDDLPPIDLAADGTLMDGMHRMRAHRAEGEEEIEANVHDIEDREEILNRAIKANSEHGKQLTYSEKADLSRHLRKEFNYTHEKISDIVGASERSVKKYCSEVNKDLRKERREDVYNRYLDYQEYPSQTDVAKSLGKEQSVVSRDLDHAMQECNPSLLHRPFTAEQVSNLDADETPNWHKKSNVWRFSSVNSDFGADWEGRIPGQIVQNLLIYYTEPYDLVVDPMAGGGTTVDVCKSMARRYAAFDVNPLQDKGIREANVDEDGIPIDKNSTDFVFLDPPYWRLKADEYSDDGIANQGYEGWLQSMENILEESVRICDEGGYVCLLMESFYDREDREKFLDITHDCQKKMSQWDVEMKQRMTVPMMWDQFTQASITDAKEKGYLVDRNRDLVVWKVDGS